MLRLNILKKIKLFKLGYIDSFLSKNNYKKIDLDPLDPIPFFRVFNSFHGLSIPLFQISLGKFQPDNLQAVDILRSIFLQLLQLLQLFHDLFWSSCSIIMYTQQYNFNEKNVKITYYSF
jgi:hypothetical protein